jgi:hypothetical protein
MANETVTIARRWLELLSGASSVVPLPDKIGRSKIVLLDLYLDDGRTFRIRPDEVVDGSNLDPLLISWLNEHRLDPH